MQGSDFRALTQGVARIEAPGALAGTAAVLEPSGFVVLTAENGGNPGPLAVATNEGKGRAVAVAHEGFFSPENLNREGNRRFFVNALTWLGQGKKRVSAVTLGIAPEFLRAAGFEVARSAADPTRGSADVLCMTQDALSYPPLTEWVIEWVKNGGGLLVAGPVWGWRQLNPGKSLSKDLSGNRMLIPLGLALTDGTQDGPFTPKDASIPTLTIPGALAAIGDPQKSRAALGTIERALGAVPDRHPLALAVARRTAGEGTLAPTREKPLGLDRPFSRLKARLDLAAIDAQKPEEVRAHPASVSFPGAVPASAPRVGKTLSIDTRVSEWHSTGLYAAPGQVVSVSIPASATALGLRVRIGAHSDTLWHLDKWERFPEVTREWPLTATETKVASAFGGPVYVVVPEGGAGAQSIPVQIRGGVEAPLFVRGQTMPEEWARQRLAPGPWAELVAGKVALTVPSAVVRTLDDPEALMAYWDEVLENGYSFYAAPVRRRPERYCVDRQIGAGYMHSGYPIMTGDDVAQKFVTLSTLRGDDGNTVWGFYHELGHNFQEPEWTWDGCGEVTNNLFSLYGGEKLNRTYDESTRSYPRAHPAVRPDALEKTVARHRAAGAPYAGWQDDPWLALSTFIDLRNAFGWEPFTKVFAEYQKLKPGERPRTDTEKHDAFVVRFSRIVGKNIRPHFAWYGIPTTDSGCRSVASLPGWKRPGA